jgi:hypothetical protein
MGVCLGGDLDHADAERAHANRVWSTSSAAGSVREQGAYTVARHGAVAELPVWLARRLTPPSAPEPQPPMGLPRRRSNAYVRAIVEREAHAVATAQTGTRHHSLLKAARTLGRLVGGDELGRRRRPSGAA